MLHRTEESDLVRDALYALQGLPPAVRKLDRLARSYSATSADKSNQNLTVLWSRSVTATALGKLLSVLARAGHLRCQLDAFVSFFLDDWDHWGGNPRKASNTKKKKNKKKKKKKRDKNGPSDTETEETAGQENMVPSNSMNCESKPQLLSSRCLVNQAFAAAVKTVLRGHSAALNTLAASVAFRRLKDTSAHGFKAENLRDQDPGPLIGYGCQETSLLEFYLHTRELRVQLQALAYVCLRRNGRKFVGRVIGEDILDKQPEGHPNEKSQEIGGWGCLQLDHARRNYGNATNFEDFPRGADLLTYLYEQLTEVDPIHQELLRFLFERAYQPYSEFIRSWLFQAAVKDPYCEFVIEQDDLVRGSSSINARRKRNSVLPADLKLRKGVSVPLFLEGVRTPLIRAGQQLQVLMKLAETCELAQQMGKNTVTSELFEGPYMSSDTVAVHRKDPAKVPALFYNKRQLEEIVIQREKNMIVLSQQFDRLFAELTARRQQEEKYKSQSTSGNPSISSLATELDNNQLPNVLGSGSEQEAPSPTASTLAGREQYSGFEMGENRELVEKTTEASVEEDEAFPTTENNLHAPRADLRPTENAEAPCLTSKVLNAPEEISSLYLTREMHEVKCINLFKAGSDRGLNGDHKLSDKVGTYEPEQVHVSQSILPSKVSDIIPSSKIAKNQVQSLIANHQRGASWPVWGLPVNPFLMPGTMDDLTPHSYAYTSFIGTFHPWDVTTKLSKAGLNSLQTSALEESARKHAEVSVEPPWFTSLASVFKDQLFEALNAHTQQSESEDADHACELEYESLYSSKQLGNGWKSQVYVELDGRLADPLNFSPSWYPDSVAIEHLTLSSNSASPSEHDIPKRTETQIEESAVLESMENSVHETESTEKESSELQSFSELRKESPEGKLLVDAEFLEPCGEEPVIGTKDPSEASGNDSGLVVLARELNALRRSTEDRQQQELAIEEVKEAKVYEAFKWEQYVRCLESKFENPVRVWNDGDVNEDDQEIPLSVVVDKCIIQEILSQYACVSTLTVRLFQEGLCLQDHCHALRRYFFMEQGDWADYFVSALCQNRWGPSGNQLRQMEVQGMLEAALQRSSCEGDKYAERLHVCFPSRDLTSSSGASLHIQMSVAPFVDCSRLDAFDFISLEYRVDWPLTLVLTSQSLRLYNMLFSFLLRIKLAVYALGDIWRRLQAFDKSLHRLSHSPDFQEQRVRFRTFQQLRQQIFHLVTTVQRYVESKLLFVVWSKFLQVIQLEVKDMQELSSMHYAYLEGATNECFLSPDTQGVKGCLDSIMQCVLDFLTHLKGSAKNASDEVLIDDILFAQVCQVNKVFQSSLQLLNIYHLKQEPQYRTNLNDLWMILDFNGFVTNALFSGQ